jgi:hypothetical protein
MAAKAQADQAAAVQAVAAPQAAAVTLRAVQAAGTRRAVQTGVTPQALQRAVIPLTQLKAGRTPIFSRVGSAYSLVMAPATTRKTR